MSKQVIQSSEAPKAIGPYSPGIKAGGLLFLSGQIPLDPVTGEIVGTDTASQADRVLKNIVALLKAEGKTTADAVKTVIYLTDLADFAAVNEVYAKYFSEPYPARTTIQVAGLPRGARVEIDVTAIA